MKRILLALLLATLALAGCAQMGGRAAAPTFDRPIPVDVLADRWVTAPSVVVVPRGQRDVLLVWELPAGSPFRFRPGQGIVFEREANGEIVQCRRIDDGLRYTCLNRNTKPGEYKYTINVDDRNGKPLRPLDPWIMND